jgi:hypothetical protein
VLCSYQINTITSVTDVVGHCRDQVACGQYSSSRSSSSKLHHSDLPCLSSVYACIVHIGKQDQQVGLVSCH